MTDDTNSIRILELFLKDFKKSVYSFECSDTRCGYVQWWANASYKSRADDIMLQFSRKGLNMIYSGKNCYVQICAVFKKHNVSMEYMDIPDD